MNLWVLDFKGEHLFHKLKHLFKVTYFEHIWLLNQFWSGIINLNIKKIRIL